MPNINQLNAANQLSSSDLLPLWSQANGDTRKLSITDLIEFIDSQANEDGFPQFSPVVVEPTATRATLATDAGSYVRFTFVGAKTYIVAPQSSVVWDDDVAIYGRNAAAGFLTLQAGAGVTLTAPSGGTLQIPERGAFILKRVAMNAWDVIIYAAQTESIIVACSDETTALTAGAAKVTFRMPYAFTLTGLRASLTSQQVGGSIFTVDLNESGSSVLSTKLTIDNGEKTSTTAATASVISDSALADDAEMTVDIDQIGDGTAKGLKITLLGYRP